MFFIDDNQPQAAQWCEYGGTCPDYDVGAAIAGRLPGAIALRLTQPGVQYRNIGIKSVLKAGQGLRG